MAIKKPSRRSASRSRTKAAARSGAGRAKASSNARGKAKRPKKTGAKPAARRSVKTAARAKAAARRKTASPRTKPVARKKAGARKKPAVRRAKTAPKPTTTRGIAPRKASSRPTPRPSQPKKARKPAATTRSAPRPPAPRHASPHRPALDRERRLLPDAERLADDGPSSDERMLASVRTGREEMFERIANHPESGPSLTAGDLDARWEDAYATGDEAPGGDNPTPDQDRVDDIGRALGVTYRDEEELTGSEKVDERDRHRWELDPGSADDWPHNQD